MHIKYIIAIYISSLTLMTISLVCDNTAHELYDEFMKSSKIYIYEKICLKNDTKYACMIILFYILFAISYLTIAPIMYYIFMLGGLICYGVAGFLFVLYSMVSLPIMFGEWCKKKCMIVVEPPIVPETLSLPEPVINTRTCRVQVPTKDDNEIRENECKNNADEENQLMIEAIPVSIPIIVSAQLMDT